MHDYNFISKHNYALFKENYNQVRGFDIFHFTFK